MFFNVHCLWPFGKKSPEVIIQEQITQLQNKVKKIKNPSRIVAKKQDIIRKHAVRVYFEYNQSVSECTFMKEVLERAINLLALDSEKIMETKRPALHEQLAEVNIPGLANLAGKSFQDYLIDVLIPTHHDYIFATKGDNAERPAQVAKNMNRFILLIEQIKKEGKKVSPDTFTIRYTLMRIELLVNTLSTVLNGEKFDFVQKAFARKKIEELQSAMNTVISYLLVMIDKRKMYLDQWAKNKDASRIDATVNAKIALWGISQNRAEYVFSEFRLYQKCFEIIKRLSLITIGDNFVFKQILSRLENQLGGLEIAFKSYKESIEASKNISNLDKIVMKKLVDVIQTKLPIDDLKKRNEQGAVRELKVLEKQEYPQEITRDMNLIKKEKPMRPLRDTYADIRKLVPSNPALKKDWMDLFNDKVIPKLLDLMELFSKSFYGLEHLQLVGEQGNTKMKRVKSGLLPDYELETRRLENHKQGQYKPVYLTVTTFKVWREKIDDILTWWVPENMEKLYEMPEKTEEVTKTFYTPLQDFAVIASEYAHIFKNAEAVTVIQQILDQLEIYGIIQLERKKKSVQIK
jgi:hypothetical protein